MKFFVLFLCSLFSIFSLAGDEKSISLSKESPLIDEMKIKLSDALINSDLICVCTPVTLKRKRLKPEDLENYLPMSLELTSIKIIFNSDDKKTTSVPLSRKVILYNPRIVGKTPALVENVRFILFLKKTTIDEETQNKYQIEKDTEVLDFCVKNWSSGICVDSSRDNFSKEILKKYYNVDNPEKIVETVEKLVRWRDAKRPKEEHVKELLELMNSTRKEPIYQENIPKILAHLGVKIIEKDNQFVIQEQKDKIK